PYSYPIPLVPHPPPTQSSPLSLHDALPILLREACVTFLFAPNFPPAMKHAGPVRRELAVGSVMNLLGPLANPAGVRAGPAGSSRDRKSTRLDSRHVETSYAGFCV